MKREQRLRSPADFARVRERAPRAWAHPLLVLYAAPNELGRTRVGVTVSRRVGNKAVVRNAVRRRIREATRLLWPQLVAGCDLVFVARPPASTADWAAVKTAVEETLCRARLLGARSDPGRTLHPPTPGGPIPAPAAAP